MGEPQLSDEGTQMLQVLRQFIPTQFIPRLLPRPEPASRYPSDPRAVFILALCIAAGIPLIFSGAEPGSFEQLLPSYVILVWGLSLVLGAAATLWGMKRQTTDGILVEQVGSVVVGCASVIYAAAIVLVAGLDGSFSAGITFGWGLSCFWRWFQLQALVNQGKVVVDEFRSILNPEA